MMSRLIIDCGSLRDMTLILDFKTKTSSLIFPKIGSGCSKKAYMVSGSLILIRPDFNGYSGLTWVLILKEVIPNIQFGDKAVLLIN